MKAPVTSINVIQILEDFSELAGGIPRVVNELMRNVSSSSIEMKILHAKGSSSDPNVVVSRPYSIGRQWSWNPHLSRDIYELISPSLSRTRIHIHGVWSGPQLLSGHIATKLNLPFIFSSHGMLEPWLWFQQGFGVKLKKHLYWSIFASRCFSHAKVIHAITPLERDHLHKLFPNNRIEIIPNAINLDKANKLLVPEKSERKKIILFIGRIEPKKGVHLLIKGFSEARISKDWRLVIIGPPWSSNYMRHLLRLVDEGALHDRVIFKGSIFGDEKREWMLKSWVLIAPSYSEAIGLVNLEASINELPTITTYETGLFNWNEGGGMLISPNVEEVKKAIEHACSWSLFERNHRGESSKSLVANKYSWDVVSPLWTELYKEI